MSSSRPWRKQTDGQAAARAYEELCQQPWYGLSLVSTGGGFCRSCPDVILLGPDLLTAMRFATDGLVPGCYAVRARIEATRLHLPDWGCLLIRGPGSWVLRARDGSQSIAPGRDGRLWQFGASGGELWL